MRAQQSDDAFAFDASPQAYIVRAGAGNPTIRVPWDDALHRDLAAVARRGCDPAVVQRLGDLLREILVPAGWDRHAQAIAAAAAAQRDVRITLRSAAAELYGLPWELLTLEAGGRHLGELPGVLVHYTWPPEHDTKDTSASPRHEGGRVLLAWSAAGGAVPAAAHLQEIAGAAADGFLPFDPARDVVKNASLAAVADALHAAYAEGRPFTILHLLCHGGRRGASIGLWLDGEGGPVLVDPGDLRRALPPLPLVVLAACSAGDPGELGNHLGSAAQALHRGGAAAVVSSRFPLSVPGSIVLTRALYRGILVELRSVEASVQRARADLARDPSALDWAGLQLYARSDEAGDLWPIVVRPYRGLLSFQREHARLFHGREDKIAELCSDLATLRAAGKPRLLLVSGASGSGKSSLVMAGLVPRLLAEEGGELVRMVPGQTPCDTLSQRIAQRQRPQDPCVLVIDQLEELFTLLPPEQRDQRQRFARELWRLASDPGTGTSVIATLRIDFIGACGDLTLDGSGARLDQIACDKDFGTLVAQMNADELRAAIERPAAALGLVFDAGLVDQILAEIGDSPANLPLLAYTLDKLWENRDGRTLTLAAYRKMGGVSGALQSHAEALVARLDDLSVRIARKLFTRMVTVEGGGVGHARRRVRVDELRPTGASAGRFDELVARLVDARLVVRGSDAGKSTVELAHEALIHRWQTLERWLREDAEMLVALEELRQWVQQWERDSTLIVDHQLQRARDLRARYPEELDAPMLALIDASELAALRRVRRRKQLFVGTVAAAVMLAVLAIIAGASAISAKRAEDIAAERARVAEAASRRAHEAMMLSAARLAGPEARALLLRDITGADALRGWLATAVAQVDEGPPPLALAAHKEAVRVVVVSGDGRWVASASDDRSALLTELSPDLRRTPSAVRLDHPALVLDIAVAPDASRVVTVAGDHVVRLWRREAPGSPLELPRAPADASRVAVDPDGEWAAAAGLTAPVLWRTDGTGPPRVLECPVPDEATREAAQPSVSLTKVGVRLAPGVERLAAAQPLLAWSPDGAALAASCGDAIAVWRPRRSRQALRIPAPDDPVDLVFAPDGASLVVRARSGDAVRWSLDPEPVDLERGAGIEVGFTADGSLSAFDPDLPAMGRPLFALRSPDRDRVLVLGESGDAAVFTLDGNLLRRLRGPPVDLSDEGPPPAAWHPTGDAVVLAARDHLLRRWSLDLDDPPLWLDPDDPVRGGDFRPGRDTLLLRRNDRLQLFDLDETGAQLVRELRGAFADAAWSPDGQRIAALTHDHDLVLWRPDTDQREIHGALRPDAAAPPLRWSPDGAALLALTAGPAPDILVLRAPDPPRRFACVGARATVGRISHDGRTLALGCSDGVTLLVALAGGPTTILPTRDGPVLDLDWNPDGTMLAVAYTDKLARVWRRDGVGDPVVLRGHTDAVTSIHWNPTGLGIITASRDNTGRVWSTAGEIVRQGEGHSAGVTGLALSPDGLHALSYSLDGTARIWSLDDEAIVLGPYRGGIVRAAWNSRGDRILTLDGLGGARLHLVARAPVRAWLTRHASGCLPAGEREALLGETKAAATEARAACLRDAEPQTSP